MNLRLMLLISLLLLCAGTGFAQAGQVASAPALSFPTMLNVPFAPCLPFSAEVISEYTYIQPDGNRVVTQAQDRAVRDTSGRTRTEFRTPALPGSQPVENIVIMDPTLQILIELDPLHRTATVRHSNNIVAEATCAERIPIVFQSAQVAPNEIPVQTFPDGSTLATEGLGTRNIEGFTVPGVRRALTKPNGEMTVAEDWYSTELQMELIKTQVDPKSERGLTLQNVQIIEPDPSLFQVPPDYTVRDLPTQE